LGNNRIILILARPQIHTAPKRHVPRRFLPRSRTTRVPGVSGGLLLWRRDPKCTSKERTMPKLNNLLIIHTTSNAENAASTADFKLEIGGAGPDVTIDFPKNQNQRGKGKLDTYRLDVSQREVDSDAAGFNLIMIIKPSTSSPNTDAWLPSSIVVLGQQAEDGALTLLGNHPFWSDWFDAGVHPAGDRAHEISGGELPFFDAG
jgi:hypothetical protein